MSSFLSEEELKSIGFASIGNNVLVSRFASIYSPSKISIGNDVRIDDFCILSGKIQIANNVHIAAGVYLFAGKTGIILNDFVGISSRSCVYAESDDYSGDFLTNPTIPDEYKNIITGQVVFEKHSLIGTGCTVLPDVTIGEGTSVGSMSLINKSLEPWSIYVGIPCRRLKERNKDSLLKMEHLFYTRGKRN